MGMERIVKKRQGIRRVMLYAKLRKWIASDFHREYLKLEHRMRCNYWDAVYHSMLYGGTERIYKIFEGCRTFDERGPEIVVNVDGVPYEVKQVLKMKEGSFIDLEAKIKKHLE